MSPTGLIGDILLLAVLASASVVLPASGRLKFYSFCACCLLPVICFLLLVFAFLSSDFALRNVFLNSSTQLPLMYKLSASFASHEGSILLWDSFLGLISFIYIWRASISCGAKDFGMNIFASLQLLFASFIFFTSNPFDSFSFSPNQGLGLNPMLQDVALMIHPPILYLGNVCYGAIFTGGLLLLHYPQEQDNIIAICRKFSSFALMLLSAGIGLGSWWAYRELGWGGYWFFDAVENISLLPRLLGIALHHFLIIYNIKKRFLKWIIVLSFTSFLLILYGTFIVRSGIITSVHSFASSPERGLYIFSICMILSILSLGWFFLRQKTLIVPSEHESSKESLILLGNIFWLIALIILVISLIYPIYCTLVADIDVVIDPQYFYNVFIPVFIPIIFLAFIVPYIDKKLCLNQFITALISVLLTSFLFAIVELKLISQIICFASIFLMLFMINYILIESNYFSQNIAFSKAALFLSHFGFGALSLAIALNCALSFEVEFVGKIGDKIADKGLVVKLEDIKFSSYDNYYRQIAVFCIEAKNNTVILKPENRLYKTEKSLSQEVDIFSFIWYDLYAVLSKVDKNIIHAKIHYQPYISFIWLSILMISTGFGVSWIGNRRKAVETATKQQTLD